MSVCIKLFLRVIPNSSKTEIVHDNYDLFGARHIKIKINAVPENDKANKAVIDFLSHYLNIKKSQIQITSGRYSRDKTVIIAN